MRPTIQSKNAPIVLSDIDEIEKLLSISLPSTYRSFLLQVNGGKPFPNRFPVTNPKATENEIDIHYFFSANDPVLGVIPNCISYSNRIPGDLIPIGTNAGGDVICLGWKGERYDKVYIWWHDYECDEEEYPCYDNVDLIANSFEEFINGFSEG